MKNMNYIFDLFNRLFVAGFHLPVHLLAWHFAPLLHSGHASIQVDVPRGNSFGGQQGSRQISRKVAELRGRCRLARSQGSRGDGLRLPEAKAAAIAAARIRREALLETELRVKFAHYFSFAATRSTLALTCSDPAAAAAAAAEVATGAPIRLDDGLGCVRAAFGRLETAQGEVGEWLVKSR